MRDQHGRSQAAGHEPESVTEPGDASQVIVRLEGGGVQRTLPSALAVAIFKAMGVFPAVHSPVGGPHISQRPSLTHSLLRFLLPSQ